MDKDKIAFRIRSVQAASVYRCNNNYKFVYRREGKEKEYTEPYLDYKHAVINKSLFALYARKHGVIVNKRGESLDFVMVKFDYGVDKDDSDKKNIKSYVSINELRNEAYENGITITWKKYNKDTGQEIVGARKTIIYRMLMRNPGKAKEGQCIFVRANLHEKMRDYLTMNLWKKMPNEKGAKIVEMSAYAPLITATAIDFIKIPLENIFVLKDEPVSCEKKAYKVKCRDREEKDFASYEENINQRGYTFDKKKADANSQLTYVKQTKDDCKLHGIDISEIPFKKECYVDRTDKPSKIENILWDGMGLIDESIFPKNMNGFIYCRSHFFKSCLFRGNIQDYFKDYYKEKYDTVYETDMLGRSIKVTDIKVIVTENSLKWIKFIDLMSKKGSMKSAFKYYQNIMKKDDEVFEIVKTGHSSKYGDIQRSSFQMNNSLLTTDRKILDKVAKLTVEYADNLKTNIEAFLEYLEVTGAARYSINNVLIDLCNINDDFQYTDYFKKKRDDKISKLKTKKMQLGKLFQYGDNLTICGNPIAMLMKVTQQMNFLEEGCFEIIEDGIQCYTERFKEGEQIAGFRSPHNSMNNIVHLRNVYPDAIKTYFPKLGKNVIIINGIHTDVQNRLNGQDLDTDSIFGTNQKDVVALARKAYLEFPTIINQIPYGTSEYDKSMLSYSKMDANISSAQYAVGLSSNIAQLALSYWFDEGRDSKELEDVFIICSVLAQVAIDSAKRNFNINVNLELKRIRALPCMKKTPRFPKFYAEIQRYKNEKKKGNRLEIKDADIKFYNCPMDILYNIIDKGIIDRRKNKDSNTETIKEISSFFEYEPDHVGTNRKQSQKIIDAVEEYDKNISKLNCTSESYYEDRLLEFEVCMSKIDECKKINYATMKYLIRYAFKAGSEKIRDRILVVLYDKDKKTFLKCFKRSQKHTESLVV